MRPVKSMDDRDANVRKIFGVSEKELVATMNMARDDQIWFGHNLKKLRKKYANQWVAIRRKRVIGADRDRGRLRQRLKEDPERTADARILFVPETDIPRIH